MSDTLPLNNNNGDLKNKEKLSRRSALLAGLLGAGAFVAKTAEAADPSCSCLEPPDCSTICPNGGIPKGDGTQACQCNETPSEQLADVAYSGSYNDLKNRPLHAGSDTDGGDARNSIKWKGKELRLNHNTTDTWIPVISGNYVDYVLKSEIGGGQIGEKVVYGNTDLLTQGSGDISSRQTAVKRDAWGRVTAVGYYNKKSNCDCRCNCDCCNCGDDGS